jgi:hypothetical protein
MPRDSPYGWECTKARAKLEILSFICKYSGNKNKKREEIYTLAYLLPIN